MTVAELRTILHGMDGQLGVILRLSIGEDSEVYLGDATTAEADPGCTDTIVCIIDGTDNPE